MTPMEEDDIQVNAGGIVAHMDSQSQTSKYGTGKNGSTGHGFAAEDANAIADTLRGRNVNKVGTNNAKNGPDRICNGIEIQTKYCKTAKATVNAAFDDVSGMYRYKLKSNGRPMKLEVPYDQYEQAVEFMRQKIAEGKVGGVRNPEHAANMIRRGITSYEQTVKITQAGTVESLIYDAATGVVSSATSAGISAAITFVLMKKNGASTQEALAAAGKHGGQTAAATMITQITVGQIEKLLFQKTTEKATEAVVKEGSKSATRAIFTAAAKSSMRSNAIAAVITTAVTTIPDINKARKGEISWGECGERATTNAGSVVSGILTAGVAVAMMSNPAGWAAIGVSLAAGMGGSIVGGEATKKAISFFKKKKKK